MKSAGAHRYTDQPAPELIEIARALARRLARQDHFRELQGQNSSPGAPAQAAAALPDQACAHRLPRTGS